MAEELAPPTPLPITEKLKPGDWGIFDENDPLRTVAVWGPIGAEAALAQFYPKTTSLFFDEMDVVKARKECDAFSDALQSHGIRVIRVRDQLAKLLPKRSYNQADVLDQLIAKLRAIQQQYGTHREGSEDMVEALLKDDMVRYAEYGKDSALALNVALSLAPELPLGNSIYARDQSNIVFDRRVRSTMTEPIRRKEVSLFEMVYKNLGLPDPIIIPNGETFEGGDLYVHNGIVYVGVGARTTERAALAIYRGLKEDLDAHNFRFAMVVDPDAKNRTFQDSMDFMHIDTFSMPLTKDKILVCKEEAARRQISFVQTIHGQTQILESGESFLQHLQHEENELIFVPEIEQKNFAANDLSRDSKTAFVPNNSNRETTAGIAKAGIETVDLDLNACLDGYGGPHCMTFQIKRA